MAESYDIAFNVSGAPAAVQAAQSVSGSLGEVGQSASGGESGLGNLTRGLGSMALKAGLAGAALKLIKTGFDEVAETERAEIHLRKVGLSADEAKKAMEALDDIELFAGDKVQAARIYGDVMNGKTRELKALRIEMSATATMEEKMAVIAQLRRRGLEVDIAKIGTVTGEWDRMKRGIGEATGSVVAWVKDSGNLAGVMGFVNTKVLGLSASLPPLAAEAKKVAVAFKGTSKEVENTAAKIQSTLNLINTLKGALSGESDDTDKRISDANIERDLVDGKITQPQADRRRAQEKFDEAEKKRLSDAEDAQRIRDLAKKQRENLDVATPERMREEAQEAAMAAGINDTDKRRDFVKKTVEDAEKKREEQRRALDDAERTANESDRRRMEKRRAEQAELDLALAKADRAEGEAALQAAQKAEDESARNNKKKLEETEAQLEVIRDKRKKDDDAAEERKKLNDKAAKEAEKSAPKTDEKGRELDSRGRPKIKAPKSNNELPPLPDRKPKADAAAAAAEKLNDATKDAGDATAKALDATVQGVAKTAESVADFASRMAGTQADLQRQLDALSRQSRANV